MIKAVFSYTVFMLELFILLTATVNGTTALWVLGALHTSCALGVVICLWWEKEKRRQLQVNETERAAVTF
jgi:predicted outer membrane lipoprotein